MNMAAAQAAHDAAPVTHFRTDGFDMTRTACDLRPWEVEERHEFATCVGERVDCAPCIAARATAARRREVDEFYALDLEHDQGDPLWGDRRAALGTYRERQGGGLSQADLPLTPEDRARMRIPEEQ